MYPGPLGNQEMPPWFGVALNLQFKVLSQNADMLIRVSRKGQKTVLAITNTCFLKARDGRKKMKKILFLVVVLFALAALTSGCGDFFARVKGVFSSSKPTDSPKTAQATDTPKATEKPATQLVVIKECNIRSEPTMDCKVLAIAKKGEKLQKIGISGNWFNIKLASGGSGWVYKDLVKEVK